MKKSNALLREDEVLTLSEIAKRLNLSEKVVLQLADRSAIPGEKVDNAWRFSKEAVDSWVMNRMSAARDEDLIGVLGTKKHLTPLPRLISDERILLDVEPAGKESILRRLVTPLLDTSILSDAHAFLDGLFAREKLMSTALSDGVAIPHVRQHENSGVNEACIVFGLCREGTDFDSLDGKPTKLFFLACSPDTATHLRLLAKITLLLRLPGMLGRLEDCKTKSEVKDAIYEGHFQISINM